MRETNILKARLEELSGNLDE